MFSQKKILKLFPVIVDITIDETRHKTTFQAFEVLYTQSPVLEEEVEEKSYALEKNTSTLVLE